MRTPNRLAVFAAVVATTVLLSGPRGRAQTPLQSGAPPFRFTDHVANVSVYSANDNVTATIPIFSKQGRGVGFNVAMVYNSSIYWNPTGTAFTTNNDIDEYGGWVAQPDFGTVDYDQHDVSAKDGSGYCLYSYDNNFRYYSPDGTMHSLPGAYLASDGTTTYPLPPGTCHAGTLTTSATASDGSGWTLSATASSGAMAQVSFTKELMTARSGDRINLLASGASEPVFEDTNGNYLSSVASSNETDWYDTTSANAVAKIINLTNCTNPVNGQQYPSCVEDEVPNADGGYATWTTYLASISVNTGSCTGVSAYTGTMLVPMYLTMPEYTSGSHWYYAFAYGGAGRLTTIDYPTGGVTTLAYSNPCTFPDGSVATVTVTTNDGQGHVGSTIYTRNSGTQTTISRPDGSKSVITYDASGLPTDVKNYDTNGTTVLSETTYTNTGGTPDFPAAETEYLNGTEVTGLQTSFDSSGDLTSKTITDELSGASRTTTISYFAPGKPSSITVSSGGTTYSQTNITYDNYSSPSALVNATTALDNHDSSYSTSDTNRGNPTEIARSTGSTTLDTYFQYDIGGNVVGTVEPNGHTVSATFGQCGGAYASTVAVAGGDETFSNDCGTGMLLSSAGPNGHATSYTYDAYGRLASVSDPDGGGKAITYDSPTEVQAQTSVSSSLQETTYNLADGYDRAVFAQVEDGTACDTVATQYNSMGRVTGVSQPYSEACGAESAPSEVTTTTYDGLGRPLTVTAPNNAVTSYAYNVQATTVTGPAPGNVTHILQTNGFGELAAVCEVTSLPGSSNCGLDASGGGYLTIYRYNPMGKLTGVNEDGQIRSFTYDDLGRMTSKTTPEAGTTTFTYGTADATCGNYSSPGNLVEKKDNMGNYACFQYDPFGRVTSITYPSGPYAGVTPTKTFVYDAATVDGQAMPNAAGRLAEAYTGSSGSKITDEGFGHDNMGQATEFFESTPNSGGYYETQETYYQDGQRETLSLPGAPTITYHPNAVGEITTVTAASGQNPVTSTSYNTAGQLTGITFGSGDSDTYSYSAATGLMTQYQLSVNGAADTGALTWNADGTLGSLQITDNIPGTSDSQTCSYGYDSLGRIASVDCPNVWSQNFTYDAFGNITKSGSLNWQPLYSAATNQANISYDSDGNVTNDGSHSYTWDAAGRPITADGTGATYDAFGRRVLAGSTEHVWAPDGSQPGFYSGQVLAWGVLPLPSGYAVYGSSGLAYYRQDDWLGSTRLATTPSRGFDTSVAYAPFSENYAGAGDTGNRGYEGLNQNLVCCGTNGVFAAQFRDLSPIQGRWLSPDPAGLAAVNPANPQTWNAYAYVANQPLTATDPLGLMCAAGQCSSMNGAALIERWESSEVDLLDNNLGCQIDGMDASCTAAEGMISDGFGVQCPNNYCGNGTKDPFQCIGSVCGYMTMQYAETHMNEANGVLMTDAQYQAYLKVADAGAIAQQKARLQNNIKADGLAVVLGKVIMVVGGNADFACSGCVVGRYGNGVHVKLEPGNITLIHDDAASPCIGQCSIDNLNWWNTFLHVTYDVIIGSGVGVLPH